MASSQFIITRLEEEHENLMHRIKLLEEKRDENEVMETDINRVLKFARYMVEHLDELVLDTASQGVRAIFWDLVFCEKPTLHQLQNRTPQISPLVQLKKDLIDPKMDMVNQTLFEANTIVQELMRWEQTLDILETVNFWYFDAKARRAAQSIPLHL